METLWHVRLLGGLHARQGDQIISRFRSQKFGALLAYLVLFPQRLHAREELADLFWSDADSETGRTNLRTALASLRRQLEPPGVPAGIVFPQTNRVHVSINREAVTSDVWQFEHYLSSAAVPGLSSEDRIHRLNMALDSYGGILLPGYYEDWVMPERERLTASYLRALHEMVLLHEQTGSVEKALDFARRAVATDPLREEAYADVIRLLMRSGQTNAANRQFEEMTRLFASKLRIEPSPAIKALLANTPASDPVQKPMGVTTAATAPPAPPVTVSAASPVVATEDTVHLPLTLTRFFGRTDEIAAVSALLQDANTRLVTVTGTGGSGKTRLVIETARTLSSFGGGIWFVPLADLRDAERIPEAVADTIGLPRHSSGSPASQVVDALNAIPQPTLLVMDNLEHLIDDAAELVQSLLEQVPTLKILVTSRQRLLLESEQELPLLPLPTPAHSGTPERLMEFASVQLFTQRAQSARADFQLSPRNADAVASLCERLEGIPLAIELAAAWAQTLSPAQMLERMENRFELLVSRRRDLSPRHRTLRATIETSVNILPPDLRTFFARLAVFHGGWTLEAADAILGADAMTPEYLTQLSEHSLILSEETDESIWFRMLETLREFAAEQVNEDERQRLSQRHAGYFYQLILDGRAAQPTAQQQPALRRLDHNIANIRAVLAWSQSDDGDPKFALQLVGDLSWFWMLRGYMEEGRRNIENALKRAGTGPEWDALRAAALNAAGRLARHQGDLAAARPVLEQARALYERTGDTAGLATALHSLGIVAQDGGDYETARRNYTRTLELRQQNNDWDGIANVKNSLAVLAFEQADYATSRAIQQECFTIRQQLGQPPRTIYLLNLGSTDYYLNDYESSRSWLEQAATLARQIGHRQALAQAFGSLGLVATHERKYREAHSNFAESLRLFLEMGDRGSFAHTLEGVALLAVELNQGEYAARALGCAEALREMTAIPRPPNQYAEYDSTVRRVRELLDTFTLQRVWFEGRLTEPEQMLKFITTNPLENTTASPSLTAALVA